MKWRSVLMLSAILIAGISIGVGLRVLRLEKISTTLQSVIPAPDARAGRAIYPYSLIPGGVRNSFELSESIAHDPVLAEHYRDIRPAAMFPLRLVTDTEGYVSYRVGSHIYWTHHLVRIRKGELVLTDGYRMVRGRCGNQIVPAYLRPKGVPTTLDPMEPPPVVFESGYPPVMNVPPAQALLAEKDAPPFPITPATPGGSTPPFWPPVAPASCMVLLRIHSNRHASPCSSRSAHRRRRRGHTGSAHCSASNTSNRSARTRNAADGGNRIGLASLRQETALAAKLFNLDLRPSA